MSVKVGDLLIGVKIQYDDKGTSKAKSDLKGLGVIGTAASTALGFLGSKVVIAGTRLLQFGTNAVVGLVKDMVSLNQKMEEYGVILETTLGSKEKANQALEWVKDFAKTTPYEIDQVTQAYVRLAAYGINAQEGVLRTLGDTASAMGKDIMWAVEALADAQTGEFERLKEFGVKAIQEQGKTYLLYTDKFGEEQKKLIDRNNREIITSTLMGIWNEKYEGGMQKLSTTWTGTLSNIKDTWNQALQVIGEPILNFLKDKGGKLLQWVEDLKKSGKFDEIITNIKTFITEGLSKLENAARTAKDMFMTLKEEMDKSGKTESIKKGYEDLGRTINDLIGRKNASGMHYLLDLWKIWLWYQEATPKGLQILINVFRTLFNVLALFVVQIVVALKEGAIKLYDSIKNLIDVFTGKKSLKQALEDILKANYSGLMNVLDSIRKRADDLRNAWEKLMAALGVKISAGVSGTAKIESPLSQMSQAYGAGFQTGGILPRNMWFFGHAGEKITDAPTTRHMGLSKEEPSQIISVNIYNPNIFDQIGITKLARTIEEELLRMKLSRA